MARAIVLLLGPGQMRQVCRKTQSPRTQIHIHIHMHTPDDVVLWIFKIYSVEIGDGVVVTVQQRQYWPPRFSLQI